MADSKEDDYTTSDFLACAQVPGESSVSGERKEKEMKKETRLGITAKKDEDFGNWYSQVILSLLGFRFLFLLSIQINLICFSLSLIIRLVDSANCYATTI